MPEERITAWLRIRDKLRFKEGMRSAARSVREFGEDTQQTAIRNELLNQILEKLERQTLVTSLGFRALAQSIEESGQEAQAAAVKHGILGAVMGKQGHLLRRNLTTWTFWKDRLSLTRAEVGSVILTIGGYLLPAIAAMTASLAGAVVGGTAVLTSGLGILVAGLSGAALNAGIVAGQFNKVKTAQDAYNLSIVQYGEGSKEAARAAGKLYAVIRTDGGRPVWEAVRALDALRNRWLKLSRPGRADLFGIISAGIGGARRLLPTFAQESNRNISALRRNFGILFRSLSGGEMRRNIRELSIGFRAILGPATRSAANVIIVLFRIMRAAAPWMVRWARSWEIVTDRWRRGTRDATKLEVTISTLVSDLQSWWALAKALGRTFGLLFKGSNAEGQKMVDTITTFVNTMNTWLAEQIRTGGFQKLLAAYSRSVGDVFTAIGDLFTNPARFVDVWVPQIANVMAKAAGIAVREFVQAWWNSNLWGKLFITWLLGKWLFGINLFTILAQKAAGRFVAAFGIYAAPRMAAMFGAESLIGSAIASRMSGLGTRAGKLFGRFFIAGFVLSLPLLVDEVNKALGTGPEEGGPFRGQHLPEVEVPDFWEGIKDFFGGVLGKGQFGGLLPIGQSALVGEGGPEIARATPRGMMIRPLTNQPYLAEPVQRQSMSISDMLPPQIIQVQIERREIARAYNNWSDQRKARRGER